jgi:hypothetical protein
VLQGELLRRSVWVCAFFRFLSFSFVFFRFSLRSVRVFVFFRFLSFSFVFFRFLSFSFVFWAPGRPSWTNEISKRSGRTLLRAKGARGALKLQLFVSGPWAIGFHVTHSFWNPCLQIVQPSLLIHKQKCRILYDVRAEYFINMCMRSLEIYAARPMGLIQVCIEGKHKVCFGAMSDLNAVLRQ